MTNLNYWQLLYYTSEASGIKDGNQPIYWEIHWLMACDCPQKVI